MHDTAERLLAHAQETGVLRPTSRRTTCSGWCTGS